MNRLTSISFSRDYQRPIEEKDRQKGFIKWGKKNDYPFFLIELLQGSAWHQGILKNKTYYIAGGGLETVSGDASQFLANSFSDFEMNEIVQRMAFDFELFGAMAVIGTWNREGSRVVRWEYIAIDAIRMTEDERLYYVSDDWSALQQTPETTNYRSYPALDENNRVGSFILYYKEPAKQAKGEKGVYPKAPYYGGITAIQTDVDISKFHMYELQNGFKAGTLINMANGYPETAEEERRIKEQIKGRTQSVEDAGEIIITFSNGVEEAPTVIPLSGNNLHERYNMTEKSVQQNILVAHSVVAPSLFGIAPNGSFNAAETAELFEIYKKTYIESRQKQIEWLVNYMSKLSGSLGVLKLVDVKPIGSEVTPSATPVAPDNIQAPEAIDVAKSALNGAQIASLVEVVANIKAGILTADSALQIILASFPTIAESQARRIVGLPVSTMASCDNKHQFSTDEIGIFEEHGEDSNNYEFIASHPIPWNTDTEDVYNKHFLLFETIGQINISPGGDNGLGKIQGLTTKYEIRYSYQKNPTVEGPAKLPDGRTRDFCAKLLDLNRLYTRDEIDLIGDKLGYDVWRYRGGWYTNPSTGITTPYCRHIWFQTVVILKPKQDSIDVEVIQPKTQVEINEIQNIKQAKEIAKNIFTDNANLKISKVEVSSEMTTEKIAKYINQLKKIVSEYNIGNEVEGDIVLSFKSGRSFYGRVETRGGKLVRINLGHQSDSAKNRDPNNRAFINDKGKITLQKKSAIDPENEDISTLTHEMSHGIAVSYSRNPKVIEYFNKLAEIKKQYIQDLNQAYRSNDIEKLKKIYLGEYANTNINEFHAEAFTEYKLMKNPSLYAKKIGELFDSFFKK